MGQVDFKWMSSGGILLDGAGDIAVTLEGSAESIKDIVRSRLKAALHGWQLYAMGADLQRLVGRTVSAELETVVVRQIQSALSANFLPRGTFNVRTLTLNDSIQAMVFLNSTVVAQVLLENISSTTPTVTVLA
jgi:hypothetical protein